MITQLLTIEDLKEMFSEILINKTNLVSKISDGSAVNAVAFGTSKLGQKNIKDVAILESRLFADVAYGQALDDNARLNGIGQRFGARQSSTYIRVVGAPGTTYIAGTNVFTSSTGINFDLENSYTIGSFGFGYTKIRSQTSGSSTNVPALSINQVSNPPAGHQYCINEYQASFGSDVEEDDVFRKRIKEGPDILSRGTISMLEQVFMKVNQNVLKVFYVGRDSQNRPTVNVVTVNGIDLNPSEINDLLTRAEKFLNISEMRSVNGSNTINFVINPAPFLPIDISFRAILQKNAQADQVRQNCQIRLAKYLDYRYWQQGQLIKWTDLFNICSFTNGIQNISDGTFYPQTDIQTDPTTLPRIRGFQMLDPNGNIIVDMQGNLNPIYYPNNVDFSFQATALQTI